MNCNPSVRYNIEKNTLKCFFKDLLEMIRNFTEAYMYI